MTNKTQIDALQALETFTNTLDTIARINAGILYNLETIDKELKSDQVKLVNNNSIIMLNLQQEIAKVLGCSEATKEE